MQPWVPRLLGAQAWDPSMGSLRPQQNPVGFPVMCQMNVSFVWSRVESPCCMWLCDSNLIQVHRDVCVVFSGTLPVCLGCTGRWVGFLVLSCRSLGRPVFISVCECLFRLLMDSAQRFLQLELPVGFQCESVSLFSVSRFE